MALVKVVLSLFLYATHHHTEMRSICRNSHTGRLQDLLERIGNLIGQPFLYLQPSGKDVSDTCQLA